MAGWGRGANGCARLVIASLRPIGVADGGGVLAAVFEIIGQHPIADGADARRGQAEVPADFMRRVVAAQGDDRQHMLIIGAGAAVGLDAHLLARPCKAARIDRASVARLDRMGCGRRRDLAMICGPFGWGMGSCNILLLDQVGAICADDGAGQIRAD